MRYNFDATGNRTGSGSSIDKNRLLSDGTYNYVYDGEGNRVSRTEIATGKVETYTWDHRNRLTKVEFRNTAGGPLLKSVSNFYDAFDRRVMKQVDDNGDGTFDRTERYVWDGDDIALVLDANGAVQHRFLHGPAIDQVFADESAAGLLWDLGDHQNTTRDVIDNTGTVVNHVTYSAFGVIASESDSTKTPFFAYTGRDWDEDLQLQYNRSRWYEPGTGRWLSEDSIRFEAGDINLQRYVGNDAPNQVDPDGLRTRGSGHHLIPWSIFEPSDVPDAVKDYWNSDAARISDPDYKCHNGKALNGVKPNAPGGYNDAVRDELDRFLKEKKKKLSELSVEEAREFLNRIQNASPDSVIGKYNSGVRDEMKAAKEAAEKARKETAEKAQKAQKEAQEKAQQEAKEKAEKELRERLAREAVEKAEREAIEKAGEKGLKGLLKKGLKAGTKKIGGPLTAAPFFLYDWYQGGFGHAVDEATWPFSEIWSDDDA